MPDTCTRKKSLEYLLEKKPELEKDIKEMLEGKTNEFARLAVACYVCDGHNYNCEEYKGRMNNGSNNNSGYGIS